MLVRSARAVSMLLAASAVLLVASTAAAQGSSPAAKQKPAANIQKVDGHDVYDFPDDPLMGEGIGANVAQVSVLRHAARASLVRPRLSFVPEMLKTAEAL